MQNKIRFIVSTSVCVVVALVIFTSKSVALATINQVFLPYVSRQEIPSPIPQPTATPPAPLPRDVIVLNNYNQDFPTNTASKIFTVKGEVLNNTSSTVFLVGVTMNVYTTSNQLFDSVKTYPGINTLLPGESVCFSMSYDDYPSNYGSIKFITSYFKGGSRPKISTENVRIEAERVDAGGVIYYDQYLKGDIRNNETMRVRYLSAIATFYGPNGKVEECMDTNSYFYSNYSSISDYVDPGIPGDFWFRQIFSSETTIDPYNQKYKVIIDGYLP